MKFESLSHVPDDVLVRGLKALVSKERENDAETLAHLAEIKDRGLLAQVVPERVDPSSAGPMPTDPLDGEADDPSPEGIGLMLFPLSSGCFVVDGTIRRETHELLCRVQALLADEVAPHDLEGVFVRSLLAVIEKRESRTA